MVSKAPTRHSQVSQAPSARTARTAVCVPDKFEHPGEEGYAQLYAMLQAEVNTHICALGQVGLQAQSGQGSAA